MPHYFYNGETTDESDFSAGTQITRDENGNLRTFYRAQAALEAEKMSDAPHQVLDVLRAMGATQIRCTYNGGYDEGFAEFESAMISGQTVGRAELIERVFLGYLSRLPLDDSFIIRSEPPSDEQKVADALDGLAYGLAALLLGQGFGTGEGSVRGVFVADLPSGQISDQE